MKDIRDLMKLIEDNQYEFEDSHSFFDGVWDAFKKINGMTVPDAVVQPSQALLRFEHKRKRSVAANMQRERKEVLDETNVYDDETFVDLTQTVGRPSKDDN